MFNKKCLHCNKKIERKFSFCPYCGVPIKPVNQEDFGLLGKEDSLPQQQMKMPMGLDKLMNSLIKQLDKELGGGGNGFNIQISTGRPQVKQMPSQIQEQVSEEEVLRRRNLPKQEAESIVRRFSDKLVYEIKVPGVKNKKDIIISKMENGFEIKAYSKDACYVKVLPVKVELMKVNLKEDTLFLEMSD